jgi:hypothetical protein
METRRIVVKNIEVGGSPEGGPAGGGSPEDDPLAGLVRIVVRVLVVLLALAIAIPVIVLGAGCLVVAIVIGLVLWGVRRILGVRAGPKVSVTAMHSGFPGSTPGPSAQPGPEDGRENVRVRQ